MTRPLSAQALAIWDALEFRSPALLRAVEPLSDAQVWWPPPNGANSIGWLLWHIAEIEDNWVRDRLLGLPKRYPFGTSVKSRTDVDRPRRAALVDYFREVRLLSRHRLEAIDDQGFDRVIDDEHFGSITVRQLWAGVATSCAWHGGQIVYVANRLLPAAVR